MQKDVLLPQSLDSMVPERFGFVRRSKHILVLFCAHVIDTKYHLEWTPFIDSVCEEIFAVPESAIENKNGLRADVSFRPFVEGHEFCFLAFGSPVCLPISTGQSSFKSKRHMFKFNVLWNDQGQVSISGIFYDVQLAQFLEILLMALECLDFTRLWKYSILFIPNTCILLHTGFWWRSAGCSDQSTSQCFPNCLKPGSATGLKTCLFHCCCSMLLPGSPFSFSSKVESDSLDVLCLRSLEETRSALMSQSFSMCDNPIAFRGAIARSRNCPESWELKATAATCPARSGRFGEAFSNPCRSWWGLISFIPFWFILILCVWLRMKRRKHDDEVDTKTRLEARIRVFHSKGPETDPWGS